MVEGVKRKQKRGIICHEISLDFRVCYSIKLIKQENKFIRTMTYITFSLIFLLFDLIDSRLKREIQLGRLTFKQQTKIGGVWNQIKSNQIDAKWHIMRPRSRKFFKFLLFFFFFFSFGKCCAFFIIIIIIISFVVVDLKEKGQIWFREKKWREIKAREVFVCVWSEIACGADFFVIFFFAIISFLKSRDGFFFFFFFIIRYLWMCHCWPDLGSKFCRGLQMNS